MLTSSNAALPRKQNIERWKGLTSETPLATSHKLTTLTDWFVVCYTLDLLLLLD